ncbi:hypothetical protein [Paracoccus ravus]|uniref:hypothetical protein n=1 Tax=Paracoccus ravus TaxID=2447760 RepID=UPI00106EC101|nr:hypothetical protein [Paracoccus ravus]
MTSTQYHLHIGAHDVYPALLESVANEFSREMANALTYMVSAAEFRSKVRPALLDGTSEVRHVSELGLGRNHNRVVMSAHGILCSKNEILTARGLYADCRTVLAKLQSFFSGEDLSLHFVAPPQHDYAAVADTVRDPAALISWLSILNQLKTALPNAQITVWPVEHRDRDAVEFCGAVLDLKFDPRHRKKVERLGGEQRYTAVDFSGRAPLRSPQAALSAHFDHVFSEDIHSILTSSVARIGLERTRREFSVS